MLRTQEKKLAQLAESWGVDYQVIKVKSDLIQVIKDHCHRKKISQRQLAAMVPGLSEYKAFNMGFSPNRRFQ
ncbi:MAG: hypothetical protein KDD35_07930 [Bdellovibrionales bacterium]|nr:hypothetical protein [Bdellovibrionales bacterium]